MAKQQLVKAVSKLEDDLGKIEETLKTPLSEVVKFVKKHKRLIIISSVVYLVYRYLFAEEQTDSDYDE